jgi:hypothetical protein
MKFFVALVLAVVVSQPAFAQEPDPATTARLDLEAVMAREGLVRELAGMGAMDQLVRQRFLAARLNASDEDRERLEVEAWPIAEAVDQAHTARMREILAGHEGWFPISQFGRSASEAAYSVVQHSGDLDLMRDVLSRMEPLVGTDELNGSQYARLWDRAALMDGRPQRYATQGTACEGGRYVMPANVEDPQMLEARRAYLGLNPMSEYLAHQNQAYGRCTQSEAN